MYLTIKQIKKHLNIDDDFTEDDEYLSSISEVAETVVQKHINRRFSDLEDENGNVPSAILHACLLMIGNLYNNRESTTYSTVTDVPFAYQYLIDLYHNYNEDVQEI